MTLTEKEGTQLSISDLELSKIGFKQIFSHTKMYGIKKHRVSFQIESLNSYFYFNPLEDRYVWYQCTRMGHMNNHICLDIRTLEDLYKVLEIFQVKFTRL